MKNISTIALYAFLALTGCMFPDIATAGDDTTATYVLHVDPAKGYANGAD